MTIAETKRVQANLLILIGTLDHVKWIDAGAGFSDIKDFGEFGFTNEDISDMLALVGDGGCAGYVVADYLRSYVLTRYGVALVSV